jgi:hypothetical protein
MDAETPATAAVTPHTVARLRSLRPGERFVYYRGDFKDDVERAEAEMAPCYANALRQIRDTARELAKAGRIRLSEEGFSLSKHPHGRHSRMHYFAYIAIGL